MWICPVCETKNDDQNEVCRCCQHPKPQKTGKAKRHILVVAAVAALCIGVLIGQTGAKDSSPAPAQAFDPAAVPTSAPTEFFEPELPPLPTPVPTPDLTPVPTPEKVPNSDDLKALSDSSHIKFPGSGSYLPAYETMCVKSEKGHSINLYWAPVGDEEHRRSHYVYEGDAVLVIAKENGFSCVIYDTDTGNTFCGWVNSEHLVDHIDN